MGAAGRAWSGRGLGGKVLAAKDRRGRWLLIGLVAAAALATLAGVGGLDLQAPLQQAATTEGRSKPAARGTVATPPEPVDHVAIVNLREFGGREAAPWSIGPSETRVPAHSRVGILVRNEGTIVHNLLIGNPYNLETRLMAPGESQWLIFTTGDPGNVPLWCEVPGHRILGMEGSLVVVEAGAEDAQ